MKRLLYVFIGLCFVSALTAQSLDRSVVSSGGGSVYLASIALDYTIGEPAVGDFSTSTVLLTQGFDQGYKKTNVGVEVFDNKQTLRVYPNPAVTTISIESDKNYSGSVLNAQGQEVMKATFLKGSSMLNISELAAGVYFLSLVSSDNIPLNVRWVKN